MSCGSSGNQGKEKGTGKGKEKGKEQLKDSDEGAMCIYCLRLFSESHYREKWIKCDTCVSWVHEECAGTDDVTDFTCELCIE